MKVLAILLSSAASLSHAQFPFGQFGGGGGGGNPGTFGGASNFQSPFQTSFGNAQPSHPFDLFSANTLNNDLFSQQNSFGRAAPFQAAPQNNFNSYSGYPFTNNNEPSNYFSNSYSAPSSFNYQQPQTPTYGYPQQIPQPPPQIPQPPQQANYQTAAAPVSQFSPPVQQYNPAPVPPAYQPPPQPAFQTPPPPAQPQYQPPAPQYNPPPRFQAPSPPTTPRPIPYINTAQLSYNAAAPAQAPAPATGSTPSDKNVVVHPPAPVHYVSIGQKLEGDYQFGYETGKGSNGDESFRKETRDADGTVRGSYGYVDPTGKQITVHYEAGREGFKILSEDEVKNGPSKSSSTSPPHNHKQEPVHLRPPPPPPAPETLPAPTSATEPTASDRVTQSAAAATPNKRRRRRRPSQA